MISDWFPSYFLKEFELIVNSKNNKMKDMSYNMKLWSKREWKISRNSGYEKATIEHRAYFWAHATKQKRKHTNCSNYLGRLWTHHPKHTLNFPAQCSKRNLTELILTEVSLVIQESKIFYLEILGSNPSFTTHCVT